MNKNPLILEPENSGDIECTLGNIQFALAAVQNALHTDGDDIPLQFEAAAGHVLALQGSINAINEVCNRVERLRKGTSQEAEV